MRPACGGSLAGITYDICTRRRCECKQVFVKLRITFQVAKAEYCGVAKAVFRINMGQQLVGKMHLQLDDVTVICFRDERDTLVATPPVALTATRPATPAAAASPLPIIGLFPDADPSARGAR